MRQLRSRCAFGQNGASLSFDLEPLTFASRPALHPGPSDRRSARGCREGRVKPGLLPGESGWEAGSAAAGGRQPRAHQTRTPASSAAEVGQQRVDSRGTRGHEPTRSFVMTRTNGQLQSSWRGKVHSSPLPAQQ